MSRHPDVMKPEPGKGKPYAGPQPRLAVIGLEAEFTLFVRDALSKPEHVFENPQAIVRQRMMPRVGRSYHLPSGGAIYFDTGVVEVATSIIELDQHCAPRAVRALWEQIEFLRQELDAWESREETRVRLEGFSTHYNVSTPSGRVSAHLPSLAYLLAHILPAPMMLLAANRLSTGIGVRPRRNRVEITADFTPDPDLMTAAASLVVGVVKEVLTWPGFGLDQLAAHGIPVITPFRPRKHTSRQGWLARFDCYGRNPFTTDPNEPVWTVRDGRTLSLRQIAFEAAAPFARSIRAHTDADANEHVFAVLDGRARSLLDFPARPPYYSDAGRQIHWNRRSIRRLPRSAYERVIHRIITGKKLRIGKNTYLPERMLGWYEVTFRDVKTGNRAVFNLDELVQHCRR